MINEMIKKADYTPIQQLSDGEYRIMWGFTPVTVNEYQRDEDGNLTTNEDQKPIVTGQKETDYCMVCNETLALPKNGENIVSIIKQGAAMGYKNPSMKEWSEWTKVFVAAHLQLQFLRERLKDKIKHYDKSRGAGGVENFTISGINIWLEKEERVGLLLRFQAEKAAGKTKTTLWKNGMSFTLEIDNAINMLYALEVYASETYDLKEFHLAESDKLMTFDEIIEYDNTVGYPKQLAF